MITFKSMRYSILLMLSSTTLAVAGESATRGEDLFEKSCAACHSIIAENGRLIAGNGRDNAPNLNDLTERAPGSDSNYRYGVSLASYSAQTPRWDQEAFVAYVMDPTGFLRSRLGDRRARSRMAYRVRYEADAIDLYAFILETQNR